MSIILELSNDVPGTRGCGIVQFDKLCTGLHVGYQICNMLTSTKPKKIPITLRDSIPELEWSQFPKFMHYITFQFTASRQVSLSLLHAPLQPKQKWWGRNRKDRVSSEFLTGNLSTFLFSPTQATWLVNITLHLINSNNYLLIIKPIIQPTKPACCSSTGGNYWEFDVQVTVYRDKFL